MDYQLLTKEDLDQFNLMIPVTVTSHIPGSSNYSPPTYDPVMQEFNRGAKRDPRSFQTFSNEIFFQIGKTTPLLLSIAKMLKMLLIHAI